MKRLALLLGLMLTLVLGFASPASADVNDFHFESFHGEYAVATDDGGRSVVTITETFVAVFPETDQNRGIRRELVQRYDGHPTDLEVLSVTDENGAPREFEAESDDDFWVLTIAGDEYVHGKQTYVIRYVQHNVTRFAQDTNSDELYGDTNGTAWAQSFDTVTASVTLTPEVRARLTGNAAAAVGVEGSGTPATVAPTENGFEFSATDVGPQENLSFAIGFEPGTFAERDSSFGSTPWPAFSLFSSIAGALVAAGAWIFRRTKLRDAPGRGIIVPEYLPPRGASLLLSSVIIGKTSQASSAQIVDLAVRGHLRVLDTAVQGKTPKFRLEFVSAEGASGVELEYLHALFGKTLTPGEGRDLSKANASAAKKMAATMTRVSAEATQDGYRRRMPAAAIAWFVLLGFLTAAGSLIFGIVSLERASGGALPAVLIPVGVLTGVATIAFVARRPLEPKGVELRDYLRGLEMYMKLAEADRIRYLQSPQGAERTPIATNDRLQLVKLNERLLPYAIIFGIEKGWAKELGRYYEDLGESPQWYSGSGAFNAALFASSIGSVSSSVSSTYSASTGGSTGGVSSGGGFGGGGGGGV